ncbi:hypothetical protein CISG_04111 [Coccidioides immitis RMSCC 3703]|uniref:Uncharacterized protein n=1 Tax=Coccidioides immitis RMSCC 3703 TaxID=454286 RepID=A0A0J8QV71_COCIT|nr:hypothetical protein CISG_04111 [Coccidioides immitis RMSCC 3703]
MEKLEHSSASGSLFRSDFSDYESLAVDGSSWDDFSMTNEFTLDSEPRVPIRTPTPAPEKSLTTVIKKTDKVVEKLSSQTDFPFSWNAFYMCLLFGAFMASNGPSMSPSSIPPLSEEYRAESANVLKAVLASANPPQASKTLALASIAGPSFTFPFPATISRRRNGTDLFGKRREQAFALTAEQYNALTTLDDDEGGYYSATFPTLQQAYAAMRSQKYRHQRHL